MMPGPVRLKDLGERRIIRDLIAPRFPVFQEGVTGVGDDCAVLPAPPADHVLVWTADPCPTPVACLVDRPDFYHYGRLTAVVNVSDLAAMGARPLGLLAATVMPEDMPAADYERFLDGLADACREWDCPVLGGNVKDGPAFTADGTALGAVRRDRVLRRTGARPGDRVCVVGESGLFWAAVADRLAGPADLSPEDRAALDAALFRPVARIREGVALAEAGGVTACMDASDGVAAGLFGLAASSRVDLIIEPDGFAPHPAVVRAAAALGVDPLKFVLAWGNWELVLTVVPERVRSVRATVEDLGTSFREVGEVCAGGGRVWLEQHGTRAPMTDFSSERFHPTSLFTHGVESYWVFLRDAPLTGGTAAGG